MKYLELLKEMFSEMVKKKDATLIPHYYHPEFELYTNGITTDYAHFLSTHEEIYATKIQYQIRYDEKTLLEQNEKIAGRVYITVQKDQEPARELEIMLIAQYKDDKLYRLWELTYPDWSKLKSFEGMADKM